MCKHAKSSLCQTKMIPRAPTQADKGADAEKVENEKVATFK